MATFHPDVVTGRMTAVRDAIDAGGAAGRLELCSANYGAVLASVTLGYSGESTGVVNGASLTLAGFPRSDASIDADGLAVVARIRTSAGADVITGLTVGMVNTDVVIPNPNLKAGEALTINAASFTHANNPFLTYPVGVDAPSVPPTTDGDLTAFAAAINLSGTPTNRWIDTNIKPGQSWAVRSMILGARDATQAEVEPGPADRGNYTALADDTLVNSNGAAWFPDRKQFFCYGGGHGGWPGNEVYWVDIPTMRWGRLTDPSPMERWPEGPVSWAWRNTDNTPTSNHTYNGIVAVPSLDSFFAMFGSPWPSGNFPDSDIWPFHMPPNTWTLIQADGMLPVTYARGPEAHYIASEGKIAIGRPNFWRWYDPVANTLGPVLNSQSTLSNGNSVATPTGIYSFGSGGGCFFLPYANVGISAPTSINTTTNPRVRAHARWLDAGFQWNSFFWDATRNMVISWSASYNSEPTTSRTDVGKHVYGIDFANDRLYEFVLSGGTWAKSQSLGSYTKFQHLVDLDCYVGLNNRAQTNGWMVFRPGTMTELT